MAFGSAPTHSVNNKIVHTPLVEVQDLLAHLALLNAFASLRKRIDELPADTLPNLPKDKDARWSLFAAFAAHRFSIWCSTLQLGADGMLGGEEALPPLDVLMVWHSYMLNSRSYAEDCVRVPALRNLARLDSSFFISHELSSKWPRLLQDDPTLLAQRTRHWTTNAKRPFDIVEDAQQNQFVPVPCPGCSRFSKASLLTASNNGYLQTEFSLKCPREECKSLPPLTHFELGLQKLVRDITKEDDAPSQYLAGTLHTSRHLTDYVRARMIKQAILRSPLIKRSEPKQSRRDWSLAILRRHEFSLERLLITIQKALREEDQAIGCRGTVIGRIAAAYSRGGLFSINLVKAVTRQGAFLEKIQEIQWSLPEYSRDKQDLAMLGHAIYRYHRFLTLLARSPTTQLIPTLDIQLVWHTHQLKNSRYNRACKDYVGRYIDFNEDLPESDRDTAFDMTSRFWEDLYDISYTEFANLPLEKPTGSPTHKLLIPRHVAFNLASQ